MSMPTNGSWWQTYTVWPNFPNDDYHYTEIELELDDGAEFVTYRNDFSGYSARVSRWIAGDMWDHFEFGPYPTLLECVAAVNL